MATGEYPMKTTVANDLTFLWLEITAKCNLYCTHCYADSGPQGELYGNMAYEDWTGVLDEAANLGCRSVQFIGGEPTMHPRLPELIEHADDQGYEFIEVYTNATRLGPRLISCLRRHGVHVATSFYTDDAALHERITQADGSWQQTVHGIESVLAAGLPLRVGVVLTDQNLDHGPRAIEFLKTLGVRTVRVDHQRGVGRGRLEHLECEGEHYEELCGQCWKGKLCVTSAGEVFPCIFSRATRLGDAKAGLRTFLQNTLLTEFRYKVRERSPDPVGDCNPLSNCNPNDCNPNNCNVDACNPNNCNPCNP
jgi:MoaA/NifB/PqqE/SkfB family radical SAM enzyme